MHHLELFRHSLVRNLFEGVCSPPFVSVMRFSISQLQRIPVQPKQTVASTTRSFADSGWLVRRTRKQLEMAGSSNFSAGAWRPAICVITGHHGREGMSLRGLECHMCARYMHHARKHRARLHY